VTPFSGSATPTVIPADSDWNRVTYGDVLHKQVSKIAMPLPPAIPHGVWPCGGNAVRAIRSEAPDCGGAKCIYKSQRYA